MTTPDNPSGIADYGPGRDRYIRARRWLLILKVGGWVGVMLLCLAVVLTVLLDTIFHVEWGIRWALMPFAVLIPIEICSWMIIRTGDAVYGVARPVKK